MASVDTDLASGGRGVVGEDPGEVLDAARSVGRGTRRQFRERFGTFRLFTLVSFCPLASAALLAAGAAAAAAQNHKPSGDQICRAK